MERKKRSKSNGWECCYANRIFGTFGVEMRACGQKLVKFCWHTRQNIVVAMVKKNVQKLKCIITSEGLPYLLILFLTVFTASILIHQLYISFNPLHIVPTNRCKEPCLHPGKTECMTRRTFLNSSWIFMNSLDQFVKCCPWSALGPTYCS